MLQDIERIEYRQGLIEAGVSKADLPILTLKGSRIPSDIHNAMREDDILNLSGVYGDPEAGDPVQYDELRIILTDDTVEIVFYNRAIALLTGNDERHKRLHRFMCKLEDKMK